MDASLVSIKSETDEALTNTHIASQTTSYSSCSPTITELSNQSIKVVLKSEIIGEKHDLVSTQYIKHNSHTRTNDCTIQNSVTTKQKALSSITSLIPTTPAYQPQTTYPDSLVKDERSNTKGNDCYPMDTRVNINTRMSSCSVRSASSPQLTIKPVARSKVYRKTSLKSMNLSNSASDHFSLGNDRKINVLPSETRIIKISNRTVTPMDKEVPIPYPSETDVNGKDKGDDASDVKNKWNMGDVHITCNPLSTPYPYSTPHHNGASETVTEPTEDEPKSRSCGSFLPILSLIPQTVISFQYLSPKMKFSWWRNKIS